jgi:hypothetical protein
MLLVGAPLVVRFEIATLLIRSRRTVQGVPGDAESCAEVGLTLTDYWESFLPGPTKITAFVTTLGSSLAHHLEPTNPGDRRTIVERRLHALLGIALECNETWIARGTKEAVIRRPLDAVKWILRQPLHRDLIPPRLAAIVSAHEPTQPTTGGASKAEIANSGEEERGSRRGTPREHEEAMKKYLADGGALNVDRAVGHVQSLYPKASRPDLRNLYSALTGRGIQDRGRPSK